MCLLCEISAKLFAEDEKKFPKNPMAENQGKLLTVEDFLELAKSKGATGVVLYIEVTCNFRVWLRLHNDVFRKMDNQ